MSAQIKRYMSQEPDVTLDEPGGNLAPNDCDATFTDTSDDESGGFVAGVHSD